MNILNKLINQNTKMLIKTITVFLSVILSTSIVLVLHCIVLKFSFLLLHLVGMNDVNQTQILIIALFFMGLEVGVTYAKIKEVF